MSYEVLRRVEDLGLNDRINMEMLHESIGELDRLIGMEDTKREIFGFIYLFIEDLTQGRETPVSRLHSLFLGEPGTGKTTVSKIFAKILHSFGFRRLIEGENVLQDIRGHLRGEGSQSTLFRLHDRVDSYLGIREAGTYVMSGRSDFVAEYQGQTAIRTKNYLTENLGKIVIVDDAYNLCHGTDDMYGREALDSIMRFISEEEGIVIILNGYANETASNIFSIQRGLERRFQTTFMLGSYCPRDLLGILNQILGRDSIRVQEEVIDVISANRIHMRNNGGDMEKLAFSCRMIIAKQNFFNKSHSSNVTPEIAIEAIGTVVKKCSSCPATS